MGQLKNCPDVDPSDETKPKAGSGTVAKDCTDTKCTDDVKDLTKCVEAYYILNCAAACDTAYKAAEGANAQGDCPKTATTDPCTETTCTGKTSAECATAPVPADCPGTCLTAANAAVMGTTAAAAATTGAAAATGAAATTAAGTTAAGAAAGVAST